MSRLRWEIACILQSERVLLLFVTLVCTMVLALTAGMSSAQVLSADATVESIAASGQSISLLQRTGGTIDAGGCHAEAEAPGVLLAGLAQPDLVEPDRGGGSFLVVRYTGAQLWNILARSPAADASVVMVGRQLATTLGLAPGSFVRVRGELVRIDRVLPDTRRTELFANRLLLPDPSMAEIQSCVVDIEAIPNYLTAGAVISSHYAGTYPDVFATALSTSDLDAVRASNTLRQSLGLLPWMAAGALCTIALALPDLVRRQYGALQLTLGWSRLEVTIIRLAVKLVCLVPACVLAVLAATAVTSTVARREPAARPLHVLRFESWSVFASGALALLVSCLISTPRRRSVMVDLKDR